MELLSQLAGSVVKHIDAGSLSRFKSSLAELTDYHRFLLEAYSTRLPDGIGESYARLRIGWRSTHEDWLSVYFEIIDSAVENLASSSEFARLLAYLPTMLLPRSLEYGSNEATNDLLSLELSLIYRMEAWLKAKANREVLDNGPANEPAHVRRYREVLEAIVNAWELAITIGSGKTASKESTEPAAQWAKVRESWPYIYRHLRFTGDMVIISTWNDDQLGTAYFRDLLSRWGLNMDANGMSDYFNGWRPDINSDLLKLDWRDVIESIGATPFFSLTPHLVYNVILEKAHKDITVLVSSILINWILCGKHAPLALDSARRVLAGELMQPDAASSALAKRSAPISLLDLLAVILSGPNFDSPSYGFGLDGFITNIDRVSERPVQSGRPYTPSTAHGRDSLIDAFTVLLVASFDETQRLVGNALRSFIESEGKFPRNDRSLLELESFIERVAPRLKDPSKLSQQALESIAGNAAQVTRFQAFATFLDEVHNEIIRVRETRIRSREVDAGKIKLLQKEVDQHLLSPQGLIPYFSGFKKQSSVATADLTQVYFNDVYKDEFVAIPVGLTSSDYFRVLGGVISDFIEFRVVGAFLALPRIQRTISYDAGSIGFWMEVKKFSSKLDGAPTLTIPYKQVEKLSEAFLYGLKQDRGLNIERHTKFKFDRPLFYIATIEGIDVFRLDQEAGSALLFAADILKQVEYAEVDAHHFTKVVFEEGGDDPWKGRLLVGWSQRTSWRTSTIFEFKLPDARTPQ